MSIKAVNMYKSLEKQLGHSKLEGMFGITIIAIVTLVTVVVVVIIIIICVCFKGCLFNLHNIFIR